MSGLLSAFELTGKMQRAHSALGVSTEAFNGRRQLGHSAALTTCLLFPFGSALFCQSKTPGN